MQNGKKLAKEIQSKYRTKIQDKGEKARGNSQKLSLCQKLTKGTGLKDKCKMHTGIKVTKNRQKNRQRTCVA